MRTREERHAGELPEAGDVVLVIGDAAWPAALAAGGTPLVLNGYAKRFAAMKREGIGERLKLIGVTLGASVDRHAQASSLGGWQAERKIRVLVLQDQVLDACWIHDDSRMNGRPIGETKHRAASGMGRGAQASMRLEQRALHPQQTAYRKAALTAVRAIYTLGLDAGVVELSLAGNGKCIVDAVRLPGEIGRDPAAEFWMDAVEGLARRIAAPLRRMRHESILIGADPEFLLVNSKGKVVPADRYLGGGHGAGTDAMVIGGKIARPVAELRPAPNAAPSIVVSHIRGLLSIAQMRIKEDGLRWVAGAMPVAGFALGGHIHLSGVPLTNRLLRQLDSYVALPLAMAEADSGRKRRPKFGVMGDCRQQPHGGFEYRTLPSWLVSPLACEAALSLALLCALESNNLDYCPASEDRYASAYYRGDRETLRECLEPLISAIRNVPTYKMLSTGIEPFMLSLRDGVIWDETLDIRAAWGIAPCENGDFARLADIARPPVSRSRGVNHRSDLL
ncbi:hypothetical protein ACFFSY_31425 [Paenibacillus aurantiacus]|uniref:Phage phiEco32-like COOH.NH2 ligase-type 2 n=1 Tax=Paenibacillus aurantiacus TaxID=1936118 RepID=A0ABV5L0W3_9BACL